MNWFRSLFIVALLLSGSTLIPAQQTIRYNFPYKCNQERVVVIRCRRDSDQPGFPATTDEKNFCFVIYPDRPYQNGIQVSDTKLQTDVIKELSACGAFGDRPASAPRAASNSGAATGPNANQPAANGNANVTNSAAAASANQHFAAAEKYLKARDYQNAIVEYQKVVDLKPDKVMMLNSYQGLSVSYELLHQYEKAIPFYVAQTTLDPRPSARWALGNCYFKSQQYAKAADAFREAVRGEPNDTLFNSELVGALLMIGKKTEAMQVYNSLLKIDPKAAKDLLKEVNDPGGPMSVLVGKSEIELLNGDKSLALEYAHTALRIKPPNPHGLLQVGEALELLEHYDEAIATYRTVIALKPNAELQAEAYGSIGEAYNELKQYTKAIPEFKESLRLKAEPYMMRELGKSYLGLKDYPTALATYQEAIRLQPDNAEGYYQLGTTYAAMNQYEKAIAAYMEVVRLEPKTGRGYVGIGHLNFALRKYPDAGRAFTNALQIDPKNTEALFGIGRTYLAVGRKPEAMRAYTALKAIDEQLAQELLNAINGK